MSYPLFASGDDGLASYCGVPLAVLPARGKRYSRGVQVWLTPTKLALKKKRFLEECQGGTQCSGQKYLRL